MFQFRALPVCAAVLAAMGLATAAEPKTVTIKGQITFSKPVDIGVEKTAGNADEPTCCKAGPLKKNDLEIDAKTNGLLNVIVWLRPDDNNKAAKIPEDLIPKELQKPKPVMHVVDQPNCQFEPRVFAAREGDTLWIKNTSKMAHNINWKSEGLEFNQTVPAGKDYKPEGALKADRLPGNFSCGMHPWMAGKIRVFDHPFFTVTDKDGKFEIKNVPEGSFRIVYAHEKGYHKGAAGALGTSIKVADEGTGTMELKPIDYEFPNGAVKLKDVVK